MPPRFLAAFLALGLALAPSAAAQLRRPGAKSAGARKGKAALERLHGMNQEERRRAIEKLPPARKRAIEDRLENYERLSEAERKRLGERFENFRNLPPAKQETVRRMFRRMNELPQGRRQALRRELGRLQSLGEDERRERMDSAAFHESFNPAEREILEELVILNPGAGN